jgi:hypothetical protein
MLVGTAVFVGGDAWLSRDECTETMRRSRQAAPSAGQVMPFDRAETARGKSIAAGIFVDGVPESIALGLTVADSHLGVALLVGVGWQPGRGIRRRATDHRHRVLEALRGRLIAAIGRASPGRRRRLGRHPARTCQPQNSSASPSCRGRPRARCSGDRHHPVRVR